MEKFFFMAGLNLTKRLSPLKIILMKIFSHRTLKKSNVTYLNTFHVETILTDTQASITHAKNVRGVQSRLLS